MATHAQFLLADCLLNPAEIIENCVLTMHQPVGESNAIDYLLHCAMVLYGAIQK